MSFYYALKKIAIKLISIFQFFNLFFKAHENEKLFCGRMFACGATGCPIHILGELIALFLIPASAP